MDRPSPSPACIPKDAPHVNQWWFGARLIQVLVWTESEWSALPEADRPPGAQPMAGGGYNLLSCEDDDQPSLLAG